MDEEWTAGGMADQKCETERIYVGAGGGCDWSRDSLLVGGRDMGEGGILMENFTIPKFVCRKYARECLPGIVDLPIK